MYCVNTFFYLASQSTESIFSIENVNLLVETQHILEKNSLGPTINLEIPCHSARTGKTSISNLFQTYFSGGMLFKELDTTEYTTSVDDEPN